MVLGLGILTAVEYWLGSNDNRAPGPVELGSAIGSEERPPRPQEGGETASRIGKETTNAEEHPENLADNVALLQKSATKGHVGAMVRLGQILAAGDKSPKDTTQAAKWMQLAAATGNAEGMFELGRYYRDGIGLPQNNVHAYVWLNRAAIAKHLSAIHERDDLVRTMNAEELREAHHLALSEDWHGNVAPGRSDRPRRSKLILGPTTLHRLFDHALRQMRREQRDQVEVVAPQVGAAPQGQPRGV
ncbi:MAG: sel1 repeat family protein [Dechloromonas sp.]|nr:MAG: sel1 repeat family protein [Dechloromonas sp.]